MVVKEAYKEFNGNRIWEVNVYRNLKDWEIQDYLNLLKLLEMHKLKETEDRVIWKLSQNGQFSCKSYYLYLRERRAGSDCNFPFKQISKLNASHRLHFLLGRPVENVF